MIAVCVTSEFVIIGKQNTRIQIINAIFSKPQIWVIHTEHIQLF